MYLGLSLFYFPLHSPGICIFCKNLEIFFLTTHQKWLTFKLTSSHLRVWIAYLVRYSELVKKINK